jgi:hypothetical protein
MMKARASSKSVVLAVVALFTAWEGVCQKKMKQDVFYKERLFTVKEAFWCNEVKAGVPDKKISKGKVGQPFFLWVNFQGKQESLDLLKENPMPIVAKWFRYSSYGLSLEGGEEQDDEVASLNAKEKWFSKKKMELKKSTTFTFSFWTSNPVLRRAGTYYVRLVYYDNTPVQCDDLPCEYKIIVTK